jgi:hypothetical protein
MLPGGHVLRKHQFHSGSRSLIYDTAVDFFREHKLVWCPIYKAASSTWMYNFCLLAGYSEEYIAEMQMQLSQLARDAFPELDRAETEEVLSSARVQLVPKSSDPVCVHVSVYLLFTPLFRYVTLRYVTSDCLRESICMALYVYCWLRARDDVTNVS